MLDYVAGGSVLAFLAAVVALFDHKRFLAARRHRRRGGYMRLSR